jgi:hypothetical protein
VAPVHEAMARAAGDKNICSSAHGAAWPASLLRQVK